jgi:hypothetical protein
MNSSSPQQHQPQQPAKKKKGLGARIRGIVRRKRRKSKDGTDGGESVGSHDVSVYSYDEGVLQQQHEHANNLEYYEEEGTEVQPLNDLPSSALDPNIMSRIEEETSEEEEDEDDDYNNTRNSIKSNHMISKKARDLPMDRMVQDDENGRSNAATTVPTTVPSGDSSTTGPLSLVLLLVDPSTLRFELLQLEFPSTQDATVAEVLEQIQDPLWRPLPFVGVMDRYGNAYKAKKSSKQQQAAKSSSPRKLKFLGGKKQTELTQKVGPFLEEACQHRPKRLSPYEPHRDVLVALLKNTSIEKMHQLARPILGEAKVVSMLEQNGYSLEGWKQDKRREATLQESRTDVSNAQEKKSVWQTMPWSLRLLMLLIIVAALVLAGMKAGIALPKTVEEWKELPIVVRKSLHNSSSGSGMGAVEKKIVSASSPTPQVLTMSNMEESTTGQKEL